MNFIPFLRSQLPADSMMRSSIPQESPLYCHPMPSGLQVQRPSPRRMKYLLVHVHGSLRGRILTLPPVLLDHPPSVVLPGPGRWISTISPLEGDLPWPSSGSTRRFFSLRARRPEHELNLWSDIPPSTNSSRELTLPPTPPPPRGYLESTDTTTATSSEHTNPSLDRLPRYTRNSLRRLGYSLSRQPSPTDTVLLSPDEYEEALRRAPSPPEMSEYSVRNFESSTFGLTARSNSHIPIPGDDGGVGESEVGATFSVVGAAAYPTPGSPGSTIDN
ncbi:hypothetical protein C8R42DRAFT_674157 [Lentinula raphanica]|nr:hypothetical protein C8R42DRAFT_674157 [Lentinula raphanica]